MLEQLSHTIVLLTQPRDRSIYVNYLADAVAARDAFTAVKIRFSAISEVKRSIRNLECNLQRKTCELRSAARNQGGGSGSSEEGKRTLKEEGAREGRVRFYVWRIYNVRSLRERRQTDSHNLTLYFSLNDIVLAMLSRYRE